MSDGAVLSEVVGNLVGSIAGPGLLRLCRTPERLKCRSQLGNDFEPLRIRPITADSNDVNSVNHWGGALCGVPERSNQFEPRLQAVPSGENLGHHLQVVDLKRLK